MRLGISLFGVDGGRSGISRYVISLLREMVDLEPSIQFDLVGFDADRELFPVERSNVAWISAGVVEPGALTSNLQHQVWLPALALRRRWDGLFLPAANRRALIWAPCPTLGTIHDLSSLHVEGKYDRVRTLYIKHVLPFLSRRLTSIVAVSESTATDVIRYTGVASDRVTVVPNAVDHDTFFPTAKEEARGRVARWVGNRPYALYLSRIEHPGKNHVRLIRAYERLRAAGAITQRLVFCGGDWNGSEEVHRYVEASDYAADIVFTGFVPSEYLRDLYCAADAMVFPSLFEGFGLPILEAMACGIPVACSDVSSMPEVAGTAAVLFDPSSEEDIARAVSSLLTDHDCRAALRRRGMEQSRGFTWENSASQTLQALHAMESSTRESTVDLEAKAPGEAVIR